RVPALGAQPELIGSTRLFVVPNPSPANAHFTLADQAAWYDRLADFLATSPEARVASVARRARTAPLTPSGSSPPGAHRARARAAPRRTRRPPDSRRSRRRPARRA